MHLSGSEASAVRTRVLRIAKHPAYDADTADFDVAVLELARVTGGPFQPFVEWAGGRLPLYSYGFGWIAPSAIGFALGLLLRRRGAGS